MFSKASHCSHNREFWKFLAGQFSLVTQADLLPAKNQTLGWLKQGPHSRHSLRLIFWISNILLMSKHFLSKYGSFNLPHLSHFTQAVKWSDGIISPPLQTDLIGERRLFSAFWEWLRKYSTNRRLNQLDMIHYGSECIIDHIRRWIRIQAAVHLI